jgi:integrase
MQIDAKRIKAWLRKEAENRPTRARLAFNLLRAFLNWCETMPEYRGIVPADAVDTRIAKDALPKKAAKADCLQREQLRAWFAAVRAIQNPTVAAYLQILLLTGARRESLAALKWEHIDFRWNSITIRDKKASKGGEDGTRTIPLTPYVAALLSDLKRINETLPPKFRILHGLRRSFASLAEWVEMPTGIVAQIMGHRPSATAERHYKVRPLDLLRQWHSKYEAWILEQGGIRFKQKMAHPGKLQLAAA